MGKMWMGRTALGLAIAAAAGCTGLGPTQKPAGDLTIKQSEAAKVRAQSVIVNGPVSLANFNGKIQSDAIASVISAGGGNVISAGGGNVISAGGGNVISAGGGNLKAAVPAFRVQAALATYTPVTNAFVYLEDVLTGKGIGKGYKTDENGQINLTAIPDTGAAIAAIARFKMGDKEYRMGVNLGMGKFDAPVYADPINTVVEGRIRQILRDSGKASALSFEQLKDVWAVFNDADVDIDVTALENGKTLEDLFNFYNSMVGTLKALDDKDPAHTDKTQDGPRVKVVKTYMKTLQAK
ncbi:MAG: hypothetical protein ACK46X_03815 [Candidatus Sericytochromatia bacterium]